MQHCNVRAPGRTTGCRAALHIIAHKLLSRAKQLLQSASVGLAGLIAHYVVVQRCSHCSHRFVASSLEELPAESHRPSAHL